LLCAAGAWSQEQPAFSTNVVGPWTPIFRGVEHAFAQRATPGPSNHVIHALRIDLHSPTIRFLTTPAIDDRSRGGETIGQTTSSFLKTYGLAVAINANFFFPCCGQTDSTPLYVEGLAVSQGQVVSTNDDPGFVTSLLIDGANVPTMRAYDWPPANFANVYTAVTGNRPLLVQGTNVAFNGPVNPRTAIGYSSNKCFLILLTIDGRQAGYSDGATDYETAEWMLRFGAYDALNLDGGGSTAMAMSDGAGGSRLLNRPIHLGVPGLERICGNHFGVYADPLVSEPQDGGADGTLAAMPSIAGMIRLSGHGAPRRTYRIEQAGALGNWTTLIAVTADAAGAFDYVDPGNAPERFYRMAFP